MGFGNNFCNTLIGNIKLGIERVVDIQDTSYSVCVETEDNMQI